MTQTVRVTEVLERGFCKVELKRESACGGNCASCGGCAAPDETVIAVAVNEAGAAAGDVVIVESRTNDIFRIAALVYLVPVVLMIAGYAAASAFFDWSYAPGIASAAGFGAGILIAVLYGRSKKEKVYLTVTRILNRNSPNS